MTTTTTGTAASNSVKTSGATTRTAVVTGATSGLGEAAAIALAKQGYRVIVVGRDAQRGADVVAQAQAAGGQAEFVAADLFSIAGARRLGHDLRARFARIDVLVNNAGGTFMGKQAPTADGLERTFALNVVAPYVLTHELLEPLAAARGRVVNLSTSVPQNARATIEQLAGPSATGGLSSYSRAKLAVIALTQELQRRYGARGVTFVSLHPGVIMGTRFGDGMPWIVRALAPLFARVAGITSTLEQAADRYVAMATGPVEAGRYYKEAKLAPTPRHAEDPGFVRELWERLEALTSDARH